MSDTSIIHPDHIRIIEKKPQGWLFKALKPFVTYRQVDDINDIEKLYGITKQQVTVELFRINGGKLGFYIADLRHKQYYYCGTEAEMIRPKLL
ncbi:hypothetical protein [Tolypothrix sp. VBCCA 56010]|uniref:hypothetical protein n=1 Tax=Tolypothrix sp. VBCCA 56010 TaxID=3137731 RepID=UPI003D7E832F